MVIRGNWLKKMMKQLYLLGLLLINSTLLAQTSTEDLFLKCYGRGDTTLDNLNDSSIDINAQNKTGNTPLMAAISDRPEMVEPLIEAGAELDFVNNKGNTALMIALNYFRKNKESATLLIEAGAKVSLKNKEGKTALMIAASHYNSPIVKLIEAGANLNSQNNKGYTALMIAASDSKENTKLLIEAGAELDLVNSEGDSALMIAARGYNLSMIKLLIKAGAKLDLKNKEGKTALMIAIRDYPEKAKLLIKAGAKLDIVDNEGNTALMIAIGKNPLFGIPPIAELIKAGAKLDIKNNRGNTALMITAKKGYGENVMPLINAGAKLNLIDKEGNTALIIAASRNDFPITELIEAGVKLDAKNNRGNTALMIAAKKGYKKNMKLLAESGANLNAANYNGQTALTILRLGSFSGYHEGKRHFETYSFLKSKGAVEQDYVKYIAENLSGNNDIAQREVLLIKQKFQNFNKNIRSYTVKKYVKESDDKSSYDRYNVRYDNRGDIVFFQHQSFNNDEWGDNGFHEKMDEQYYFENGKLYFYFQNGELGKGITYGNEKDKEFYQLRVYVNNGKEVIAASKHLNDSYGLAPSELNSIDKLINIKSDTVDHFTVDEINVRFNTKHDKIKYSLK